MNTPDKRGFTLIELMIVVVVVGILALLAIPRFSGVSDNAKRAEAEPILRQYCQLASADRERLGAWPTTDPTGWQDPNAKFFAFAFDPGDAVVTALAGQGTEGPQPGLANRTMNCETGQFN